MRNLAQRQPNSVLAGTTPVPNHLLDEIMPRLTDTQLRVLLVVVRSTLGWQEGRGRKEKDWISHRQLQSRTGRSSAVVSRAVAGLIAQGLIRVTDNNDRELAETSERSRNRGHLFYALVPKSLASSKEQTTPHADRNHVTGASKSKASRRVITPVPPHTALKISSTASETLPHNVRTTKETGTKEIRNIGGRVIKLSVPTLESEVMSVAREDIQSLEAVEHETHTIVLGDANAQVDGGRWKITDPEADGNGENDLVLTAEAKRFIATFDRAYRLAKSGESPPLLRAEAAALLERRLKQYSIDDCEAWLPRFFECNFGYVRRRHWSLESYLDSMVILGQLPPLLHTAVANEKRAVGVQHLKTAL